MIPSQTLLLAAVVLAGPFHGIRPTDPAGRDGLWNPERGLRIETLIAEPEGAGVWGPASHLKGKVPSGYTDQWWILDAASYKKHGLTLAQTYCYLDRYRDRPLSSEKLSLLQKSLDNLRKHGLKALLRFAYEKDTKRSGGPTLETILRHIEQLAPVIRANRDVIFVLQAGFVGAWGEWHNSTHGLEKDHKKLAAIVRKVLDVLPENLSTQVRVPKYKRWILSQPAFGGFKEVAAKTAHCAKGFARIGFHNDGFLAGRTCGGTWPEPPFYSGPGNPEFDYMTRESPYVPVDGELFWADQGGKVDGLRAAVRMRLHHYTSFSLAHSFSLREGKPYSIDTWMKTPLSAEQVRRARLPLSDGYFEDEAGNPVTRSQFEYIRDHLGYRFELQRCTFPGTVKAGGPLTVRIDLINRGFSVLHNPRPVYVALVDAKEKVQSFLVRGARPALWQPFEPGDPAYRALVHTIALETRLPGDIPAGEYLLGLWMPDRDERLRTDPRYAVRTANRDVAWWTDARGRYGINLLGTLRVAR